MTKTRVSRVRPLGLNGPVQTFKLSANEKKAYGLIKMSDATKSVRLRVLDHIEYHPGIEVKVIASDLKLATSRVSSTLVGAYKHRQVRRSKNHTETGTLFYTYYPITSQLGEAVELTDKQKRRGSGQKPAAGPSPQTVKTVLDTDSFKQLLHRICAEHAYEAGLETNVKDFEQYAISYIEKHRQT